MANTRLGIDTDVIVDYLRRRNEFLERAISQFDCLFTAITVYELEIGLIRAPGQYRVFQELLALVSVLPLDQDAAHAAAQVYERLGAQGLPIGLQDTLIAGTCIAQNVPLLTRNIGHFGRIPELTIVVPAHLA
jgi:predicted nucleic acid-binding protein